MLPVLKQEPIDERSMAGELESYSVMEVEEQYPAPPISQRDDGNDDELYTDEEITLYVDFDMCLDVDDPNLLIKVIGIESDSPVIQVNDEIYRGTTDFAFGTYTFFEKDPERTAALDPVFEGNIKDMYQYVDKTDKVLRMKRIFLTEKNQKKEEKPVGEKEESSCDEKEDDKDKVEVTMTYEEALNLHLSEGNPPPRHIAPNLNGGALVKKRFD